MGPPATEPHEPGADPRGQRVAEHGGVLAGEVVEQSAPRHPRRIGEVVQAEAVQPALLRQLLRTRVDPPGGLLAVRRAPAAFCTLGHEVHSCTSFGWSANWARQVGWGRPVSDACSSSAESATTELDKSREDRFPTLAESCRNRCCGCLECPVMSGRALVLGGGGSAGNAWLIGVIAGLFEAGLDVTEADLIIGTSAGSTAAAQMAGAGPTELLAGILGVCAPAQGCSGGIRGWARPPWAGGGPHGANGPHHRCRCGCGRHAPQDGCGGARDGCGVGWLRACAVARYRRRSAAQSALAAPKDAHHGGRCPYR